MCGDPECGHEEIPVDPDKQPTGETKPNFDETEKKGEDVNSVDTSATRTEKKCESCNKIMDDDLDLEGKLFLD